MMMKDYIKCTQEKKTKIKHKQMIYIKIEKKKKKKLLI